MSDTVHARLGPAPRKSGPRGSRVPLVLGAIAVAMFGFGFAVAPLYSMLCEVAGLRSADRPGATARAGDATASAAVARSVTVRFDTNVASGLPWEFKAVVRKLDVSVGRTTEARFTLKNLGSETIVGRAVPAITPWQATQFFVKSECFCFREQTLKPGESIELPVRFKVTGELPADIRSITLSYTFMKRDAPRTGARETSVPGVSADRGAAEMPRIDSNTRRTPS